MIFDNKYSGTSIHGGLTIGEIIGGEHTLPAISITPVSAEAFV